MPLKRPGFAGFAGGRHAGSYDAYCHARLHRVCLVTGYASLVALTAIPLTWLVSGPDPRTLMARMGLLASHAVRRYGDQHVSPAGALPYAVPSPDRTRTS
ncbi:hypothetical protein [Komagataeibacter xylinus]|uniref:hypothetical protein n=1 Tax=Komagataeibacter xylinus TaxID=28448 RepID=UPI00280BD423|nr:hypothetical protein [Komagataeibacter xylinus]